MDPTFLARGIVLGFAIAAAVGPISLLTIRRTLAHGQLYGLVSGAGVALADATYAGGAAFGLTAVTNVLVGGRGGAEAALLTVGVFCGSLAWWGLLTAVVARLRSRVTTRGLTWINRISGFALAVFGLVAVITSAKAIAGA